MLNKKEWTLIVLLNQNTKSTLITKFLQATVKSISNELNLTKIWISGNLDLSNFSPQDNRMTLTNELPNALDIISKSVTNGQNTVFCADLWGYIDSGARIRSKFIDQSIYTKFTSKQSESNYSIISKKFNIDLFVDHSIMIIPSNNQTIKYINAANDLSRKLNTPDKNFVTNVALTILARKYPSLIKNIQMLNWPGHIINIDDTITPNLLIEHSVRQEHPTHPNICYDSDRYLFYPHLDIDCLERRLISANQSIFNSTGFIVDPPNKSIYGLMYRRYDSNEHGIYLKKNQSCNNIVPKIVHHICTNDYIPTDNIESWKKIHPLTWMQMIWTNTLLKQNFPKNNRWIILANNVIDGKLKSLIIKFAILEKYGGLVIDPAMEPVNRIPDDLMSNNFFTVYADENKGTDLSYCAIGSIKGLPTDTKLKKDDDNILPTLFNEIYYIVSKNNHNWHKLLNDLLLTSNDVVVYPSMLFNMDGNKKPETIGLYTPKYEPDIILPTYNPPTRSHLLTTNSIVATLSQNPRDRIKNVRHQLT